MQSQHAHESGGDSDNYACTVVLRDSGIVLAACRSPRAGSGGEHPRRRRARPRPVRERRRQRARDRRGLYNDEDRPPPNADGQAIWHLPLGAADDEAVHLELHSDGSRKAVVKLGSGLELTFRTTTRS